MTKIAFREIASVLQPYSRVKGDVKAGHDLIRIKQYAPIIRLLYAAAGSYSKAPSTSLITIWTAWRKASAEFVQGESGL